MDQQTDSHYLKVEPLKKAFVVMPFENNQLDILYKSILIPAIESIFRITCNRGDDLLGSTIIVDHVLKEIRESDFILVDLTALNPNVMFEAGYAAALGKKILYLARQSQHIPHNIMSERILKYEHSHIGYERIGKVVVSEIDTWRKSQNRAIGTNPCLPH